MGRSLPEGWTDWKDPETGKILYYNGSTNESTFERPLPAGWEKWTAANGNVTYEFYETKGGPCIITQRFRPNDSVVEVFFKRQAKNGLRKEDGGGKNCLVPVSSLTKCPEADRRRLNETRDYRRPSDSISRRRCY